MPLRTLGPMTHANPRRDALIDRIVTATLLGCALLAVFIVHDLQLEEVDSARVPLWAEYALTIALIVPLAWRRRFPLSREAEGIARVYDRIWSGR